MPTLIEPYDKLHQGTAQLLSQQGRVWRLKAPGSSSTIGVGDMT